MPGFPKLSLVEGAFEELGLELAAYLDTAKGESSNLVAEITPLLADPEKSDRPKETDRDAVLKKLVGACSILNGAPERELQAAYNLLIHLVSQAEDPDMYIARICQYLKSPITSSPHNGAGIALGILSTLYNTVEPDDSTRFNVLLAIVEVIKGTGNFETFEPQLKNVDSWIQEWELEAKEARSLYLSISDAAAAAKEPEQSYFYLLKALKTTQNEASSPEARDLSIRALKLALQNDKHFDFQDLTALDSIQSLRKSDQVWSELLEIFSAQNYDDFADFKEANNDFLSTKDLDEDVLDKKMRQLTLASLAAQASSTRTLPYGRIAKELNIPTEDVEMWVIDSIRSGLVEGKLSQAKQEFLVHRSTYRVFTDNQWREVASRLETWRSSLTNVLAVIRAQKEEFVREKEAELTGSGVQNGQGYRPDRRQRNAPERQQQQSIEVE
ncbi:Eukaryotic translation initiation factor 3 subunit M [Fulvia fulva]|uniref:Eukaryotic translation initiation factor 3 subunit M n=1 Tax=Passalora fulva TaxID=5499 RepID=A0A9Q8PHC6_PASFU|nr:Eukaryotic translation initiation factor 3 subunit M [Fulvia fulva]KAK4616213.1 Eukaryotic translation initiation factor 3 subunit M [Fulvia fulva]KAK4616592.1 Eukaryotic translation initiation factor 3 subunit M [Fulvia fulva]UJO22483.1 Eukaryotic translation initiation factor 3 subunit M [Fulvia fulva]WPV19653.1 Eukaryotic translation initiation factor 3 subunit M [Fulvia fulva]WPV33823.1 Eukaryotic translation initiation factor 3 subunit M [Fulvia fulva]